jgi:hypothetical protein
MIDDRPPFLRSWRNVYVLIAAVLAVEIIVMYWITQHFS